MILQLLSLSLYPRIIAPCALTGLVEPDGSGRGWTASYSGPSSSRAEGFEFDVLVVASGKKVCVDGFNRRSLVRILDLPPSCKD